MPRSAKNPEESQERLPQNDVQQLVSQIVSETVEEVKKELLPSSGGALPSSGKVAKKPISVRITYEEQTRLPKVEGNPDYIYGWFDPSQPLDIMILQSRGWEPVRDVKEVKCKRELELRDGLVRLKDSLLPHAVMRIPRKVFEEMNRAIREEVDRLLSQKEIEII